MEGRVRDGKKSQRWKEEYEMERRVGDGRKIRDGGKSWEELELQSSSM